MGGDANRLVLLTVDLTRTGLAKEGLVLVTVCVRVSVRVLRLLVNVNVNASTQAEDEARRVMMADLDHFIFEY